MRILFSDEKNFDTDGVYDLQNGTVWTSSRSEANERDRIVEKRKVLEKIMVWLGAYSKGISALVIFEKSTLDYARYMKEVLLVAFKYGNKVFDNDRTFRQDEATSCIHQLTEQ